MTYDRTINWNDLPHNNFVGYGIEGLVLRLDERRCIKIYTPWRSHVAQKEFENYQKLREAGFLVPEPEELVEVYIGGQEVKLPGRGEILGLDLYKHKGLESVPGVIKEFFPGVPYGRKKPTINELSHLMKYLRGLESEGLTFLDGIILDFIASDKGTALIDCSTLIDKERCQEQCSAGFIGANIAYQKRIWDSFESELIHNKLHTMGFEVRLAIAGLLRN